MAKRWAETEYGSDGKPVVELFRSGWSGWCGFYSGGKRFMQLSPAQHTAFTKDHSLLLQYCEQNGLTLKDKEIL